MDALYTLYIKNSLLSYWRCIPYTSFMILYSPVLPYLIVPINFIFLIPCQAEEINS